MPVAVPAADPATTAACTRLLARAPARVAGLAARQAVPASPLTRAWGTRVALQCGVAPFDVAQPSPADLCVDGTTWRQDAFDDRLFRTAGPPALAVRVRLPTTSTSALGDLGDALFGARPCPG